jgi:hypothetical protein
MENVCQIKGADEIKTKIIIISNAMKLVLNNEWWEV